MSFIDIQDPKKRDAIVADYLATVKRIQRRNLNERAEDLIKEEKRNELFKPVVVSTEKSTATLHKELKDLKESFKIPAVEEEEPAYIPNKYDELIRKIEPIQLDNYYSIQKVDDDEYKLGNKVVTVDGSSNIIVDGVHYPGTDGLWLLIMTKKPNDDSYDFNDLASYKKLVKQTNLSTNPSNVTQSSRPTTTYKYRQIISSLGGEGIQFLPGDIKGLSSKLNVLLAEYAAGNKTSTRSEIVSILDELLRRKRISRSEYNNINNHLSK